MTNSTNLIPREFIANEIEKVLQPLRDDIRGLQGMIYELAAAQERTHKAIDELAVEIRHGR